MSLYRRLANLRACYISIRWLAPPNVYCTIGKLLDCNPEYITLQSFHHDDYRLEMEELTIPMDMIVSVGAHGPEERQLMLTQCLIREVEPDERTSTRSGRSHPTGEPDPPSGGLEGFVAR